MWLNEYRVQASGVVFCTCLPAIMVLGTGCIKLTLS